MATKKKDPVVVSINWRKSLGQWSFRMVADNGEPMNPSERYTRKATMDKMIDRWNIDTFKKPVPVIECNSKWKPIKK